MFGNSWLLRLNVGRLSSIMQKIYSLFGLESQRVFSVTQLSWARWLTGAL